LTSGKVLSVAFGQRESRVIVNLCNAAILIPIEDEQK